ncbi:MAG: hypothetical protein C0402_06050 [Thermodesulfovibrio sp.]|nr:hypothetical protein [Thermodesulfovibrio sp.]
MSGNTGRTRPSRCRQVFQFQLFLYLLLWSFFVVYSAKSAEALTTFPLVQRLSPGTTYDYPDITSAYAEAADGDTLSIRNAEHSEDLFLDLQAAVTLKSGYESAGESGSVLHGTLTVSGGPVTVSGLLISGSNIPTSVTLRVKETQGISRSSEVVRSGIPIPLSMLIYDVGTLAITDVSGATIPAEFEVLARRNAGRTDITAPIQWLLVTFPATVQANGRTFYRLVTDGSAGSNPQPEVALTLQQAGSQITVNTGAATFKLGGSPDLLFDEIRLQDDTRLVNGGAMTAVVNGSNSDHTVIRSVEVEHTGPLAAIVTVKGEYTMPEVGGGKLASFRRYVFTAGSPTAIVRQAAAWEGALCSYLTCDPGDGSSLVPNGLLMSRIRNTLLPDMQGPLTVTALGGFSSEVLQSGVVSGQEAWVRQSLRTSRTDFLSFDISVPGTPGDTGTKADWGLFVMSSPNGSIAMAIDHMHRYEPQALRLLPDGNLAIDLLGDKAWIGQRQGLYATFAVSVLPPDVSLSKDNLGRIIWAPLNHALRAWPHARTFLDSQAVEEFPVGTLSPDLAAYDTLVSTVLDTTGQKIEEEGISGIMTFGLYPRYWGYSWGSGEVGDCGESDPTPGEAWDDAYWCSTWTDYHNTTKTGAVRAMRTGETDWLDELAVPAALRMLHTQIYQCAPGDLYFYCGQSPAGYGGYRSDFNSSHAYFENLFLYYWLTGDKTVVDMVKRGASSMRDYLCVDRPAAACAAGEPPTNEWAGLTGRVASQWLSAFRFIGLAGDEAGYLDDYRSGLARAVTQNYVLARQQGTDYGFWLDRAVTGPGTYPATQLWLGTLYDMNNLYQLQLDTDNAAIGIPAITPGSLLVSWARTLNDFGPTLIGDGSAYGQWPNEVEFTWTGDRINGTLTGVSQYFSGADAILWDTGKATLTATFLRAADQTGDQRLRQMGFDLTQLAIQSALANMLPLGKEQGLYLSRLHSAVSCLNNRSR